MNLKSVLKCTVACLVGTAPAISQAAIPASYYPAYYLHISQNKTVPGEQSVIVLSNSDRKNSLATPRTPASIDPAAVALATPSRIFYSQDGKSLSPELIATFHQIRANEKPLDMAQLIPMDMQPSDSSERVFSQVADRSLTTFFNSQAVRESAIGQTATAVEKKMKQEVVIAGNGPKAIQHKFNFNLQAFQATAQVQYTGFTNAALKYKIGENKLALEVFEKIGKGRDMVVSHTMSSSERISEVSMRWSF